MIKVIIERKVALGLEANYIEAVRATLKNVLDAPGYVSSESLTDVNQPKHKMLITKWTSVKAWDDWHSSEQRLLAVTPILAVLEEPEKITIFEAR